MQCPDCGAVITSEDAFCGECGRPLAGQAAAPRRVTPAEVRDRPTEAVSPPPRPQPTSTKSRKRLPILIAAGVGALLLCVCGALVAGLMLFRLDPGQTTQTKAPVVVLEVTATPFSTGVLLYSDDFADEGSGWDIFDEDDTTASYVDGEYRVGVYQGSYMAWGNPLDQQFDDFVVEVDARTVEGPLDNNFGVLVRYQPDGDSFYWFQISADGFYAVDILDADEWSGLVDWVQSDAIQQGIGATNHIRVVCEGDRFIFYVNDAYLTDVSDASFGSGNVGLAVGTFDEPGAVVHFDNLKVYSIQE
jgi:hypothetical protein